MSLRQEEQTGYIWPKEKKTQEGKISSLQKRKNYYFLVCCFVCFSFKADSTIYQDTLGKCKLRCWLLSQLLKSPLCHALRWQVWESTATFLLSQAAPEGSLSASTSGVLQEHWRREKGQAPSMLFSPCQKSPSSQQQQLIPV